jgi:hypothetical protein
LTGTSFVAAVVFASATASAQAAPPAGHEDAAFDVMNLLAQHGFHDIADENWNAYGQFTYISSWKFPFYAPYTNANGSVNSLVPDAERSFTGSFTLFFGLRLWHGAEAYFVPEVIAERPLSNLRGIGGAIQNFELQKTGSETPQLYRSRTYLRQTFGFGGRRSENESGAAPSERSRRSGSARTLSHLTSGAGRLGRESGHGRGVGGRVAA